MRASFPLEAAQTMVMPGRGSDEAFADDRMIVGETSARIFDKAKPPHLFSGP